MYIKNISFGRKKFKKFYKLFFRFYLRMNIYFMTQFKFNNNFKNIYNKNNKNNPTVTTNYINIPFKKKNFLKIIMFLCKNTNIRGGTRFQKIHYKLKPFNRKWFFVKKFKNLKNNFYQHKFTKKHTHYAQYDYNNEFPKTFLYCVDIMAFRYKYIALYKSNLGLYLMLPLIDCINLGDKINLYKNVSRLLFFMYVGSILKIIFFDILFIISNIGANKPKWALSLGTYSTILNKKKKISYIQLPSTQCKWFSNNLYAILGRNAGKYNNKQYFGKASENLDYKRIIVRSVAKNPVDHPNGGRTRGKMLFKTPWGKVAKNNK